MKTLIATFFSLAVVALRAATLTVGTPSVAGNTLSLPVTATGGGVVSLAFGATEPKDGEPVASEVVETRTLPRPQSR